MAKVFPYSNLGKPSAIPLGLERSLRIVSAPEVIRTKWSDLRTLHEVKVTQITNLLERKTP